MAEFNTNEQAYLGHDNPVSITPYSDYNDRTNWDMVATTKVVVSADLVSSTVTGDDIEMDSSANPTIISFNQVSVGGALEWQIHMVVGMFTGIVAGAYKLRVIIEDAVNTNGIVIADDLLVDVVDIP
jgi:hypothetical protein